MRPVELLWCLLLRPGCPPLQMVSECLPLRLARNPTSLFGSVEFSSLAKCSLLIPSCVSFVSVAESEEALLKMSVPQTDTATPALPDFSRMTEDEQIAYALQMSMQGGGWSLKTFEKHDLDLHIDIQPSITFIHIGLQCKFVPLSQRLEVRTWTLGLTWNPVRPR